MAVEYTIHEGTHYDARTPLEVAKVLSRLMSSSARIRIWLGDPETGKAWDEESDVVGYVGRSTGSIKIPLLVHSERSSGGPAMLDNAIIRIDTTTGHTLYQHPKFHTSEYKVEPAHSLGFTEAVMADGSIHAQFKKPGQAQRWIDFMTGRRYNK